MAGAVGVDDRAGEGAALLFRIEVDGATRFEAPVQRGQPLVGFSVDRSGAETVLLVAEPALKETQRTNDGDWPFPHLLRTARSR